MGHLFFLVFNIQGVPIGRPRISLYSKSRLSPSAKLGYAAAIRAAQPHDHKVRNSELSNSGVLPEAGNRYLPGTEAKETEMTWTTPTLVEICVGLEINGYLPAEF